MKRKFLLTSFLTLSMTIVLTGCSQTNIAKTEKGSAATTSSKQSSKAARKSHSKSSIYQYLGLSKKTFKKERNDGKSIVDIAKEQNKTEQQVINYMLQQRISQLKQKKQLSDSRLSKKKAAMTQKIRKNIESQKKPHKKQGGGQ